MNTTTRYWEDKAWHDQDGRAWLLRFGFELREGRMTLVAFEIEPAGNHAGHEVTGALLREIPLARLTEGVGRLAQSEDGRSFFDAITVEPVRQSEGDRRHQEVARIYLAAPSKPTKAVKEAFGVSDSAAYAMVHRARQAGYLAPTTSGRRGGRPTSGQTVVPPTHEADT